MKRFTALAIMMAMLMGVLPAAALAADGRGDPVTWKIGHDWETGKAGYVDQNGDWAIEPRYDQAWEFDETGHAIVEMRGDTYSVSLTPREPIRRSPFIRTFGQAMAMKGGGPSRRRTGPSASWRLMGPFGSFRSRE